jgi:hypothetical protein
MHMNASARSAIRGETDQAQEHGDGARVDAVPQKACCTEQAQPRNPVGPDVPAEGTFETFMDGAGI